MQETILRSEAMRIIRTGQPVTIECVTADRRRGTGGELLLLKNWQLVQVETVPGKVVKTSAQHTDPDHRDPHHNLHKTFNIMNPGNRKLPPVKVHYRLLVSLNNKRVING